VAEAIALDQQMNASKPGAPETPRSGHEEALLDEALEETFPASDPPALVEPGGGITGAEGALQPGDALVLVDVQRDFCPGGALPIERGDEVVPVLNSWIKRARELGIPIVASRDWHPPEHLSFKPQGGEWPVHCVEDSSGAAFHPDLELPSDAIVITKGNRTDRDQYSAFDATGLVKVLRDRGVKRVFIGGLAQDVCVRATALDAAKDGFETHLIAQGSKPVTPAGGEAALAEMRRAGVKFD
jgi:nicotinamidase/pyrazinamidase